ncbi:MAG: hypothetical protein OEY94_01095 [Alphaproteobacteria bacterium]|nr:hypothetical protein [Alphaproteobacteria bacterium]
MMYLSLAGHNTKQISELTNLPPQTVNRNIAKIRSQLPYKYDYRKFLYRLLEGAEVHYMKIYVSMFQTIELLDPDIKYEQRPEGISLETLLECLTLCRFGKKPREYVSEELKIIEMFEEGRSFILPVHRSFTDTGNYLNKKNECRFCKFQGNLHETVMFHFTSIPSIYWDLKFYFANHRLTNRSLRSHFDYALTISLIRAIYHFGSHRVDRIGLNRADFIRVWYACFDDIVDRAIKAMGDEFI